MPVSRVTLLSRPGCHLCDDAREAVGAALAAHPSIAFEELSIADDAELAERYAEEIPVVLLDGEVHTIWRVDPARLNRALEASS